MITPLITRFGRETTQARTYRTITAAQRADVLLKLVELASLSWQPRSAHLRRNDVASAVRIVLYAYCIRG